MPYTHTPIFPNSKVSPERRTPNVLLIIHKDIYSTLRARVYWAFDRHSKFIKVVTQSAGSRRYAFLHRVLRGRIQPFIHSCNVKIIDAYREHHNFCFVFKNHRDLPINYAVEALCPNTHWKGDIAILRTAIKFDGIVNMCAGDQELADFALKKYRLNHSEVKFLILIWS